jgi:hypothetical protein
MKTATGFQPHQNARDFTEALTERFETNKAVNPLKVFDGLVISWLRRRRYEIAA